MGRRALRHKRDTDAIRGRCDSCRARVSPGLAAPLADAGVSLAADKAPRRPFLSTGENRTAFAGGVGCGGTDQVQSSVPPTTTEPARPGALHRHLAARPMARDPDATEATRAIPTPGLCKRRGRSGQCAGSQTWRHLDAEFFFGVPSAPTRPRCCYRMTVC